MFKVYKWMLTSDGWLAVRFLTVNGSTYEIHTTPGSAPGENLSWTRTPFRTSTAGGDRYSHLATASGWQYFYVQPQTNINLIRLEIVK